MIHMSFIVSLLSCVSFVLSEVTVLKLVQTIYESSPKLRIRGSGFDVEDHDITLDIGSRGQPTLVAGKDYLITTDGAGDGLILKLITNKKWVDLSNRTPPVALVLNSVKFKSHGDDNLLIEPIIVAQVLATPTVNENDLVLYQTASNELRINGTGFIGAKKVDLYFDPPLTKEVAYEDVSPYPLTKNQVVLRLRHGYEWREDVGPLRVLGVDTGGGPVKVNGDEGVEVGDVELDRDEHNVSVEDTADTQLVYTDDPYVFVHGSNFNEAGNLLRFANGILGNDVNYTTLTQSTSTLKLHLSANSHWRVNMDNLPGALTLLAVNAGGGYVAVGPLNSGKGRDIATVFERPNVYSNNARIYRTHSHELHVQGTGFPSLVSGFKPQLRFSPALTEGLDYTLRVVSRLEMELTLIDGMAWRSDSGPLMVTHINTRGDTGGWVALPGNGVHIAEVVDDVAAEETGGAEIFSSGTKVYQSAKQETITVTGSGFKEGMSLTLDPPLVAGTNYILQVMSEHQLLLKLSSGKKWRPDEGLLLAKKVKIGGKEYALAGKAGITIAVVLANPVITPSETNYHESQSKLIIIKGSGFTTVTDTTILLHPTSPASYKVLSVMEDAIHLQLQPGMDWLPAFSSLKGDDARIELNVSSIDTGAGMITFAEPIEIGSIIKDLKGVTCDDSCEFAFDGVCDDGSDVINEHSYQNDFNDMDDGDFRLRRPSPSAKKMAVTQQKRPRAQPFDDFDDEIPNGGGYYYGNQVSACAPGTDCTDCSGVNVIVNRAFCTNDCIYARDGVCDDPRGFGYCALGSDCEDCGPVSSTGGGSENRTVQSILQDTGATQRIYNDAALISVKGTVLHPSGSSFRWSNKMRGEGLDYELMLVDHSTMTLHRAQGFLWERAFYHLPTVLYVEAINDGQGSVKFRQLPGLGVAVATIFERPTISLSSTKLYRTQSRTLHIQGSGFPASSSGFEVSLQFSPPLKLHLDYTVEVISRTDLFVNLRSDAVWMQQPGPLLVTAVNTAGGEDQWVWFAGTGVQVADVGEDPGAGAWVQQAFMIGGAVVAVVVSLTLCYRRGMAHAIAGIEPKVEIRYIKVPASEFELEMVERSANKSNSNPKIFSASSIIESSGMDANAAADIEKGGTVCDEGIIREAVRTDPTPQISITRTAPPTVSTVTTVTPAPAVSTTQPSLPVPAAAPPAATPAAATTITTETRHNHHRLSEEGSSEKEEETAEESSYVPPVLSTTNVDYV